MAYMITDGRPSITTIKSFLGLNMNETGETQLKLGEASRMKNFRITKDNKLQKMYGYIELYNPNARVRAIWAGNLNGTNMVVYVANGKVYKGGATPTELGSLTDSETTIFEFNKKLYFINGSDYKYYDGTNFAAVTGYVPLIKISCTPAGVGDDYEPINMLSAYRKVSFSGDGTSTVYTLPETGISSATATVGGTSASVTVQSANGTVTFSTAPAQGTDNVVVTYQKSSVTTQTNVTKNHYAQTFGLASDTRVFLYGNADAKNRIYYSDLGNGTPDVTYFPANNFIDVGSSNDAVTDIQRQYDRLIVSKENETYYMTYEPITDTTGDTIITFPTYPLNKAHGMVAKGQGQLLDNYVTSIDDSGIIQWLNTQSKDERNATVISTKVNEWLQSRDLTKAVTLDNQEDKEYWLAIDNEVMVYNYENGAYFGLTLPDNVRAFYVKDNTIYMGTDKKVMQWSKTTTTYNNATIEAEWQGGFYDFEREYQRKTMRILWIALKPAVRTSLKINYITDRNTGTTEKEISQNLFSYPYWDYSDYSYETNNTVKPYKIKLKAKKFAFLKLILKNDDVYTELTVDSISIQKAYGGMVK